MLDNPDVILRLLHENGHTDVEGLNLKSFMQVGVNSSKVRASLIWKNGTTTEVIIKGTPDNEGTSASVREGLFYLFHADELSQVVETPRIFLAVVSMITKQQLIIMENIQDLKNLQEVLEQNEDGSERSEKKKFKALSLAMETLAKFTAIGWMRHDLKDMVYLQGVQAMHEMTLSRFDYEKNYR